MATALNFPSSLTLSYHKLFLRFRHEHHPKILFTTERFAVCAAASRKPRSGRKAMSNVELLDEIKQFLYSVGLPEDHVPSTKELSLHGRIDLANIVRRRGYKLIGELLAESKDLQADGWNGTKIQMETQLAASDSKEALEGQDEKLDNLSELLGLVDNSGSSSTDMPSNDDTSFGENYSSNGNLVVEVEEASSLDVVDNLSSSSIDMPSSADSSLEDNYSSNPSSNSIVNADDSDTSFKYYSSSSLEEMVAKFMENDYLEPDEGTINYNTDEEQRLISAEFTENENKIDIMLDTDAEMQLENLDGSESSSSILNQITATKLESTIGNSRANNTRDGQLVDADLDKALDAKLNEQESLNEISHLKQTLQQKEWELSQLKEMIEQERLALSSLQDKVESEISKAQKLILEKDAELQAAEESLSGLVEVEIQYSGEGEIVEVTGSFNGWEHRIKMKPEELPNSTDSLPSSKSKQHWSTTLWLYPGMYEIKFVIDGQWKIDAQKETVNKGAITNNILRVHQQ